MVAWLQSHERNLPSSDDLEQMFQQAKSEGDVYFETANVVQASNQESTCVIDETRRSSLRKLL